MSRTEYETVITGLHARFAAISDFRRILDYEPLTVHEAPILYSLFDRMDHHLDDGESTFRRPFARHSLSRTYRVLHRAVFRWSDVEYAEREMQSFVSRMVDAVENDTTAGGATVKDLSHVMEIHGVFVTIGGTVFRCLDCYTETTVMTLYQ